MSQPLSPPVPRGPAGAAPGSRRSTGPFGRVAAEYTRARPGYPSALVQWALGTRPLTVAEVGAASGQLTGELLAGRHRTIAVEPSPELLAVLHERRPAAVAVRAVAEQLPLRSGSVDAVAVAQALHLMDTETALPEFARILRPGGALAVFWNTVDITVPWARRLFELAEVEPGYPEAPVDAVRQHEFFGEVAERPMKHWHELDRNGLVDLIASFGPVAGRPADERAELLEHVRRFYDLTTPGKTLQLPLRAHALRSTASALADYHRR